MFKAQPFVTRLAFLASDRPEAQEARGALIARYGEAPMAEAQVVVALGGDGFMLETVHELMQAGKPIYGMNRGSVGFLMNEFADDDLLGRINSAEQAEIHPLRMQAVDVDGQTHEAIAFNEVSLLRTTRQAAKLRISVDGKVRLSELICDGALISTPMGSTAYNLSAHGPIIPMDSKILALTPISAFAPAAGAAPCSPTIRGSASRCWKAPSAPSAPSPTTSSSATSSASTSIRRPTSTC